MRRKAVQRDKRTQAAKFVVERTSVNSQLSIIAVPKSPHPHISSLPASHFFFFFILNNNRNRGNATSSCFFSIEKRNGASR